MNFQSKAQSIHEYLDKIYERLIRDCSNVNDWATIESICGLEAGRLSNYAYAVKEDVLDELRKHSEFSLADESRKREVLSAIESIHHKLAIPAFAIHQSESMETVYEERPGASGIPSPPRPQRSAPILNIGTPIGAVVGIGIAAAVTKSIPLIVLGTVGGAIVGTLTGKAVRLNSGTQQRHSSRVTADPATASATAKAKQRISHSKLAAVIERRRKDIVKLFDHYLQQIEDACGPIL
ncbi:hypothetical protein D3P08_06160 [Paenibacillus nanensis]|uniref:Uncharacterized protein n=1 Tax=Paenibacillus nanensis TaxID=393251 RepID=A0A3A1VGK8_9BACL|nr:hypothetical protein [Paenibacillus nanensis]RIX59707.1 hypothetical protein D3P08_06160 [Paenibacillus nanensis]